MKLIVLQAGVNFIDRTYHENYAWIRNNRDGRWVLNTVTKTGDINTLDYGYPSNIYEVIRQSLRDAVAVEPRKILLELLGDVTFRHMNKPVTDHFGSGKFEVETADQPVDFPRIGH